MFPLPLASGLCVKTWAVVLWNLCEVSHRGGGSSSKFKNVLGIMQNLVWSVPDVRAQSFSLSASGRMPDLMEQWFCDKFSREHWIKILMLTAILSCEDAQSLPYAFLSHLEGLKYISVCKHIYLDTYIIKTEMWFLWKYSQLLFHFNHLVCFECIFLSRVHEKVFVFLPLLTSLVPTFSFLPLIWRKFSVLLLSAIPAGNL